MATERIISDRIISTGYPGQEGYYGAAPVIAQAPAFTSSYAPVAAPVVRPAPVVLDNLKNYQVGVASEIYALFEERAKQLDAALNRIRDLENSYVQNQNVLKDKDGEINNLRNAIAQSQGTKKNAENQIAGVAGEVQRLQAAIAQSQAAHRQTNEEKIRIENDIRAAFEQTRAIEVQSNQLRQAAKEVDDRFNLINQQKENDLGVLKANIDQLKQVNASHAAVAKDREAEVINLRQALQQLHQLQFTLAAKDQEAGVARAQLAEISRIFEEHHNISATRDQEILKLEGELKETRQRFVNSKRANQILLKKVITLSEDVEVPEEDDEESDDELQQVRNNLQERLDNLRGLFPTQQAPAPAAAPPARPAAPAAAPPAARPAAPAAAPAGPAAPGAARPAAPASTAPKAAPVARPGAPTR